MLLAYRATEFAGSVCTWTPDLYRQFGKAKRASSGKALPDIEVRIVDPETGTEVATGDRGVLEARIPSINPDWVRTTDLASVNVDGFITLHGRADGAINRGGFKILPETVRRVLMSHPAVRDACVVGVPDARLGEVPFAAFETAPGMPVPSEAELKDLVREVPATSSRSGRHRRRRRTAAQPVAEGEFARRRRPLRRRRGATLKVVVARRVFAVVVHFGFVA